MGRAAARVELHKPRRDPELALPVYDLLIKVVHGLNLYALVSVQQKLVCMSWR